MEHPEEESTRFPRIKVSKNPNVLAFLADVPRGKHIVLFFEDSNFAEMFKIWYLLCGLVKGEMGIYVTNGEPNDVRRYMMSKGIDVNYFEKTKGKLHIRNVFRSAPARTDDSKPDMKELYARIFEGVGKTPVRVLLTSAPFISSEREGSENLEVESSAMAGFNGEAADDSPYSVLCNFPGSILCHYHVDLNGGPSHLNWIEKNAERHDAAIYLSRERQAVIVRHDREES